MSVKQITNKTVNKKMKKFIYISAILPILAGCSNVREIGKINDTTISRISARGLFSPSATVLVASSPDTSGVEVIAAAEQPGTLNAVATAGGLVGAAAVLRPPRSSTTSNSNGGSSNGGSSGAYAKGGKGGDSTAVNVSSNSSKSSSDSAAVAVSSSSSAASAKNNNANLNLNNNENSNKIQVEAPKHICPPKCNQHGNN